MEEEDFLAAVEADNANAPVEEPKEPEAEPEKGKEPEPEATPEPEQPASEEPAQPDEPEPKPEEAPHAPLTALLDEREKRQAAERELAQLRAQQQPAQVEAPDPIEDPEGYASFQEARLNEVLLNQTLNTSERFARKEYGAEAVEAAKVWARQKFASDPFYQRQVLSDPDPYEKVVTDYRRDQLFSKVSDPSDFDAFLAWKAAQGELQQQQAAPAAPPNPAPSIPPKSLASAPSAGGIATEPELTEEQIFEEVIPKG